MLSVTFIFTKLLSARSCSPNSVDQIKSVVVGRICGDFMHAKLVRVCFKKSMTSTFGTSLTLCISVLLVQRTVARRGSFPTARSSAPLRPRFQYRPSSAQVSAKPFHSRRMSSSPRSLRRYTVRTIPCQNPLQKTRCDIYTVAC